MTRKDDRMTTAWPYLLLAVAALLAPPRSPVLGRLHPARTTGGNVATPARQHDPLAIAASFDLLGACLRAGLPTAAAARAVLPAAPPALADPLRRAADLLALGADPVSAWTPDDAAGGSIAPEFESLARMARRSARAGSSLAAGVGELAEESRARVEQVVTARAERAGVLIGGPLGLCFLPAFVCLGIVPVIIGLAGRVLGGAVL